MTNMNYAELCERLRKHDELAWDDAQETIFAGADAIEALTAKCALLAASLAQEEREKDEAEKHAAKVSAANFDLEAQLKARGEPVALVPTPMTSEYETEWRMDAYYYGFAPTGIGIIDRILSAVACAGKAFHHTNCWTDKCSPYEYLRGESVADWIQNAADDAADALRANPPSAAAAEWISVSKQMPESGKTVLATYLNRLGKPRRIRAQYIAANTRESDGDDGGDLECVYDETSDTYYWPEGWYECIDNWPDYTHVLVGEGTITHWMPLPAALAARAKDSK